MPIFARAEEDTEVTFLKRARNIPKPRNLHGYGFWKALVSSCFLVTSFFLR